MNKYSFTNNGRTFERVSKAMAKKAFINGFTIAFCPSNLCPGTMWHPEFITDREARSDYIADVIDAENDFHNLLNSFEYYNCTNTETGKYTAFFIETGSNYIHLSFSDGSNPWIFYGNTLECMNQLERWKKHYNIEFQKQHHYMVRGKTMIMLLDSTGNIFAEGNSIREILNELNSDSEWYYIYRPDNYTVDAYYAPNEKEADNDINGENADEIYDVINIKCDGKRV